MNFEMTAVADAREKETSSRDKIWELAKKEAVEKLNSMSMPDNQKAQVVKLLGDPKFRESAEKGWKISLNADVDPDARAKGLITRAIEMLSGRN